MKVTSISMFTTIHNYWKQSFLIFLCLKKAVLATYSRLFPNRMFWNGNMNGFLCYVVCYFVSQRLQHSDHANMSGCHRCSFIVTMTASRNLRQSPPWVNRSIHFNFWRCNSVFLHVEGIVKIKEIRDEYLFHHWNSITGMHFWPSTTYIQTWNAVRIITNNPFLFPTHERWIPLFSLKTQANCIFLINHQRAFV